MAYFCGYRIVEAIDPNLGGPLPVAVMYPTTVDETEERFTPHTISVSRDAPLADGRFPVVMISHGSGGTHLVYHTLARHLARNGFVVGMPEHPFNNRQDNSAAGTANNLLHRPEHLRTAIDVCLTNELFAEHVVPDAVSVIGHSMGAYTALALAGGAPSSHSHEEVSRTPRKIEIRSDKRIKSLVLLAPASVWFREQDSLKDVDVPILLMLAEKDDITPRRIHGECIIQGVPDPNRVTVAVVENAGHFSFLSPFPPAIKKLMFPPSQDPAGFNREEFMPQMNSEIEDFLRRTLRK